MKPPPEDGCILLTGAGSTIGSAIAKAIAKPKVSLALHCNQGVAETQVLADELQSKGCLTKVFPADLTEEGSAEELVRRIQENFSHPTALVNNAGSAFIRVPLGELTPQIWRKAFLLNAEVPFLLCKEVVPAMYAAGGGRIVNISSVGVKYGGSPTTLHYSASKGALETFSMGLARQLAPAGIRVNVVRPGFTESRSQLNLSDEQRKARVDLIPIGRSILPEETAATVAFLLSPDAAAITGEILTVAGGD